MGGPRPPLSQEKREPCAIREHVVASYLRSSPEWLQFAIPEIEKAWGGQWEPVGAVWEPCGSRRSRNAVAGQSRVIPVSCSSRRRLQGCTRVGSGAAYRTVP